MEFCALFKVLLKVYQRLSGDADRLRAASEDLDVLEREIFAAYEDTWGRGARRARVDALPFGGLEAFFDGLALSATETKINRASPSLSEKLFGGFGFVRRAAGFLVTPEAPEVEKVDLTSLQRMRYEARGFFDHYVIEKRLQAGAQGVTYIATEIASGNTVVVKQPNNVNDTTDFDELCGTAHPHIVRIFACFHNPMETYIVIIDVF